MRIELTTEIADNQAIGLAGIKRLADTGNIDALNILGEWLIAGFECSPDANYACTCFEKAARQGNTQAMLNFGICYIEGHGVPKDFYAAERWIRAADELGDKEAKSVCEKLYMSSIGAHKPDIYAFVDFLYTKMPRGNVYSNERLFREDMVSYLVLQKSGKSEEEIEVLKSKVTENDVHAYESMNDLYYVDDAHNADQSNAVFDKSKYIQMVLLSIDTCDRTHLSTLIKLAFHLIDQKNSKGAKNLLSIGTECDSKIDYKTSLSWYERAMFDICPAMLDSFSEGELFVLILSLRKRLLDIENQELSDLFKKAENDRINLRKIRKNLLLNIAHYEKALAEQWLKAIESRICSLEDAHLFKLYSSVENDYEKLVNLHASVSNDVYEPSTKEKWLNSIANQINTVQEKILYQICDSMAGKSYHDLVDIYSNVKERYTFNSNLLQHYLSLIAQPIDSYEISVLEDLCSHTDGLISAEYATIIGKIEALNFKESNVRKYLDAISQKLNNASIVESCDANCLEDYDIDQLNDRNRAIHFSTLLPDTKVQLTQRVTSYIDLIYACKDKHTLELLDNCEPGNIENLSLDDLTSIMYAIQAHIRLDSQIKEELILRIETRVRIVKFEKLLSDAGRDYDDLLAVKKSLLYAKLSASQTNYYEAIICTKISDAQKVSLDRLTSDIKMKSHYQLKSAIKDAKHFDFDKQVLQDSLLSIEKQLDIVEQQTLIEVCGDISSCTIEDIIEIRKKISKLGFMDSNVRSFKKQLDARYDDLIFEGISKKCTQSEICQLAKTEDGVTMLLEKLINCGRDETELAPYIKRVRSFLFIQEQLRAEVAALYQKHFDALQAFVVSEMSSLTFPMYCCLTIMCVFKPDEINKTRSRLKCFKVEGLEQTLFVFDETPAADFFIHGLCITNYAIHYQSESGIKHIPLEAVTEVKTGKLFESIIICGSRDNIKIGVRADYNVRTAFVNTLLRIISIAKEHKGMASSENENLAVSYLAKFDECFANTPIPNDNTFEDRAMKIQREATRKVEAIANSPIPTSEELIRVIPELLNKYKLSVRYQSAATTLFVNKLSKARSVYALYDQSETPLILEDHTVFGNAKAGFVLTNKALYVHAGGANGRISLERITSVFDSYHVKSKLHYICIDILDFDTTNGNAYVSYCGDDATANTLIKFWTEVLELLGRSRLLNRAADPCNDSLDSADITINSSKALVADEKIYWLCTCGKTNEGNFCAGCGTSREGGTPLWKCSCGNLNKGKFCPKCGAKKN